jgi:hypothetical protein
MPRCEEVVAVNKQAVTVSPEELRVRRRTVFVATRRVEMKLNSHSNQEQEQHNKKRPRDKKYTTHSKEKKTQS